MNPNVEVNVAVENKKDSKTGAGEKNKGTFNKFLTVSKLRESFNLNFESTFLDMFTEVKVARVERVEAPRAERKIEKTESPRAPEPVREERRVESPKPVEAAQKPAEVAEVEDAPEEVSHDAAAMGMRGEVEANDAPQSKVENSKSEIEQVSASMKMVRVEMKAQIQKLLTVEEQTALKKKITDLLEDDDLSARELLAGVLNVVSELIGPVEALDVVAVESESFDAAEMKQFLKKFMREISKALENAEDAKPAMEAVVETPKVEQKVEDALAKLVRKMDRNVTQADQEAAKNLARPEVSVEDRPREERIERPVETKRSREVTNNEVRLANESRIASNEPQVAKQGGGEAEALAAAIQKKNRPTQAHQPVTAPVATGVAEVSRSARSENAGSQSWQNLYNQNSSTKFSDRAQEARRNEAPRPTQNPIFEQIVQNAKITVTNGKGEAVIKLNPEMLGKVEMKIVVEDGKVNVKFTAENAVVQNSILENVNDLKRSLTEAGLDVENVSVTLSDQSLDADGGEREEENPAGRGRRYRADEEDFFETIEAIEDGSTVRYLA